jgi:hypothetical protein
MRDQRVRRYELAGGLERRLSSCLGARGAAHPRPPPALLTELMARADEFDMAFCVPRWVKAAVQKIIFRPDLRSKRYVSFQLSCVSITRRQLAVAALR